MSKIVIIDGMQFKVSPQINAKHSNGDIGKLTITLVGLSDEIDKLESSIVNNKDEAINEE